jgi:hypothetical protein
VRFNLDPSQGTTDSVLLDAIRQVAAVSAGSQHAFFESETCPFAGRAARLAARSGRSEQQSRRQRELEQVHLHLLQAARCVPPFVALFSKITTIYSLIMLCSGEKQLFCLARALLKSTSLVVFDEAESAPVHELFSVGCLPVVHAFAGTLDDEAARALLATSQRLLSRSTRIFISHR